MKCPICQSETKVFDSRSTKDSTTRRRECVDCLSRFSTQETILVTSIDNYLQNQLIPAPETSLVYKGKWSKSDTDSLVAMHVKRIPHREIAKSLNRTYWSVAQQLTKLRKSGIIQ
jgi:hypothetical protein